MLFELDWELWCFKLAGLAGEADLLCMRRGSMMQCESAQGRCSNVFLGQDVFRGSSDHVKEGGGDAHVRAGRVRFAIGRDQEQGE